MRPLLPKKEKYYADFSDAVYKQHKKLRYGIDSCNLHDLELSSIRKELVDWQSREDEGALSEVSIQYRTWLAVEYDDVLYSRGGVGYINSSTPSNPQTLGLNYVNGNINQNIIEVNAGGCITRINLNPSIVVNQNSSFSFIQQQPSTVWDIQHNMGMTPNVFMEDLNGNDIMGIVEVVDQNRLKVYFNQPVAGKAFLS